MPNAIFKNKCIAWTLQAVPSKESAGEFYYDEVVQRDYKGIITNWPPQYCDLNAQWVVANVCERELKVGELHGLYPTVFTTRSVSAGYIQKGRPAKELAEDQSYYYVVVYGIWQMSGAEGRRNGLAGRLEGHLVSSTEFKLGNKCIEQDLEYTGDDISDCPSDKEPEPAQSTKEKTT